MYPQSNSEVERFVQTIKNLLVKADYLYISLLVYCSILLRWCNKSPAEISMGRKLRTYHNYRAPTFRNDLILTNIATLKALQGTNGEKLWSETQGSTTLRSTCTQRLIRHGQLPQSPWTWSCYTTSGYSTVLPGWNFIRNSCVEPSSTSLSTYRD